MAAATVNLLSIAGNPTGKITADLEYDDVTLDVTALIGTNTTPNPLSVKITRSSDGVSRTVAIPANVQNRRVAWSPNWAKVVVTPDDVIPPIRVDVA